jgi:hypothetical protein
MWCAIAMPPYGGFFMAVDPLQKHIFRGALYAQRLFQIPRSGGRLFYSRHSKTQCDNPLTPVQAASKQGCWPAPDYPEIVNRPVSWAIFSSASGSAAIWWPS